MTFPINLFRRPGIKVPPLPVVATAAYFNAINSVTSSLQRVNTAALNHGAKDWAYTGWFKMEANIFEVAAGDAIVTKTHTSTYEMDFYWTSGGDLVFTIYHGGSDSVTSTVTPVVGQWHFYHLQYTDSTKEISIAVDGEIPVTAIASAASNVSDGVLFRVGANGGTGSGPRGRSRIKMSQVGRWDRTLLGSEVLFLRNAPSKIGRTHAAISAGNQSLLTSMVAYWDLDDISDDVTANTWLDKHTNGYDLVEFGGGKVEDTVDVPS